MTNFIVLFKKELLEQWRTKKILILLVVFIFVVISSPIIAKLIPSLFDTLSLGEGIEIKMPDPTAKDAIDQFIKNISQTVVLVLLFIFSGSVADEKNRKTLELTLTKPLSRKSFILTKFFSAFLTTKLSYIFAFLVFIQYTRTIFGSFNILNFAILCLLLLLLIFMLIAITIMASTIFSSNILAAAAGFLGYIVFGTITSSIKYTEKFSPGYIMSNYKDLYQSGWSGDFLWPVLSCLLIIVASIVISLASFSRQEIER